MKRGETDNDDSGGFAGSSSDHSERVERLVSDYIDRLVDGETLDFDDIVIEHPDLGEEVISHVRQFVQLGESAGSGEALGALGDFTLRRQIGRGGMGVVYEAWENSMDRVVALKVLPVGVAADERAFQRFMREARAAGRLSHPNIVAVHAMGQVENTPYYAMDFVEGETLAQVLAAVRDAEPDTRTEFGPKDGVDYFGTLARDFADVADGLQHAHGKGVVHRDVKPSNLILDAEGRLRILDFGLARLEGQESLTSSGDFVGTPLYTSPEMARRQRIPVDHRTDIYSLGATMYETLTGKPPFRGKDHADTLSQIIERAPVEPRRINPRVPGDLETIVLKCLRKRSADRYGSAEALGQDLRRFVRGVPIEARPQSRLEHLVRGLRQRRSRIVTISGFLVLALVAVFLGVNTWLAARRADRENYDGDVSGAVSMMPWSQPWLRGRSMDELAMGGQQFELGDVELLAGAEGRRSLRAAELELARVAEAVPERPEAFYYRARALTLLGRQQEALAVLELLERRLGFVPGRLLAAKIRGDDVETVQASPASELWQHWVAANRAMQAGRWKDAINAYAPLLARKPALYIGADLEFRLGSGYARLELGDLLRAREDFIVARAAWPTFVEPALLLGRTYLLEGHSELAAETFERLHADATSPDDAAFWIATLYRSHRDYEPSLRWARRVTEESIGKRLEAATFLRVEKYREAIAAAERAIQLDDSDVFAHMTQAYALWFLVHGRSGPGSSAVQSTIRALARRAVELAPDSPHGNSLYGVIARDESYIEKARELDATRPIWRVRLALLRYLQERHEEAEQECRKAMERSGYARDEFVHLLLGLTLVAQKRLVEGREEFLAAVELQPQFWHALQHVGETLSSEGRHADAVPWFERATALDPQRNSAHVKLAEALWKLGRLPDAMRAARQAIVITPDTVDAHVLLHRLIEQRLSKRFAESVADDGEWETTLAELEAPVAKLEEILESPDVAPVFLVSAALLRLFAVEGRDADRALVYASRAVAVTRATDSHALCARALVYVAKGDVRKALESLNESAVQGEGHRFYQLLHERLGEWARAESVEGAERR